MTSEVAWPYGVISYDQDINNKSLHRRKLAMSLFMHHKIKLLNILIS